MFVSAEGDTDKVVKRSGRCKYGMNIDVLWIRLPFESFTAAGALCARKWGQPLLMQNDIC